MTYRIGDDPSAQTIYNEDEMVAVGCTPESARGLVDRLNSAPARQDDVDLLLWLLAEKGDLVAWHLRSNELLLKQVDQLTEQLDAARMALQFWSTQA